MPWRQVASGTYDRNVNPADGVGSLKQGPRTHPAHAEGRLVYKRCQSGRPKWKSRIGQIGVKGVKRWVFACRVRGWCWPPAS